MKQDRTSKLHVRPALVVLALAAAGLLAGCATPLTGMPHDASVETDPIAELRRLGEAVVADAPMRPNPVTQDEMDAGSIELF